MSPADSLVSEFLGEIELAETALLGWGVVDAFTSEPELLERADDFLARKNGWAYFTDARALLDTLWERRLVFHWQESGPRYRSRFAETLRLLARLRQLFPKHFRQPGGWITAPTLVADFRLVLRARSYPRRDIVARDALQQWAEPDASDRRLSALQRQVLASLVGAHGTEEGFPLAGFQVRATRRILSKAGSGTSAGTMVCAGTGSGKTLAFYLPALAQLAGSIEQDAEFWTRALAIYPRKELLKDQFTECMRLTRRVNAVLRRSNRRALRIGALYGDVPQDAQSVTEMESWRAAGGGRVCPFVTCPEPDCGGELLWLETAWAAGREELCCGRCNALVSEDEIVLTRRRMQQQPPDLVFTTTEMVNRRLSDSRRWHLFGVGVAPARRPLLMLLDEAHTYAGVHGAQVAYLLRRWRHRSNSAPHIVGLSATLVEAAAFFSQLTGLPEHLVEEVSPEPGELTHEGSEYLVAVRGDPVSGASLLSTTIQTAMLLRRSLDPLADGLSHGFFGSKLFVFTDNLDVTNRLYFNLLDAEGLDSRGQPDVHRHPGGPLAALRQSQLPEAVQRRRQGQSWDLCEEIGHRLRDDSLRVGRVSSQDPGVDTAAEMIVATAALEVGFNDPGVGAVLQHKAPHDDATFLQRKGRAGRRREMRPWLVVVLSDYGRDRLAYGGYDLLFDPELRPRDLPLRNRHVLKMQAVYATLDWLGLQMPPGLHGQIWSDASTPWRENSPDWHTQSRLRQEAATRVLEDVLSGGDAFASLQQYLGAALRLRHEDDLTQIFWEPPRALLTAALPTLLRRLKLGWVAGDELGREYHVRDHPLPEFVPASLFSDLNLPEIIVWAVLRRNGQPEPSPLPATQALREFAPGRLSRRFGIWHSRARHWIPVDPAGASPQPLDVGSFCPEQDREALGDFCYIGHDGSIVALPVFRPYALRVRHDVPANIADSANAFLDWRSQILPPSAAGAGFAADLPSPSRWEQILPELRFFTHQQNQPARVRRFALGSNAEVRFTNGDTTEVAALYQVNGAPAAIGFAFEADGVRAQVRFPAEWQLQPEVWRALRPAYFRARLTSETRLDANRFEREWLAEIVLSALTANAISLETSLSSAWEAIRKGTAPVSLDSVLEVIFQSVTLDLDGIANDEAARLEQRRQRELGELLGSQVATAVFEELVPLLWEDLEEAPLHAWLEERFLATVGAGLLMGIQQICPDAEAEDLLVDLGGGVTESNRPPLPERTAEIWISEHAPGGGGVIERFLPRLAEEPRRFFDLLVSEFGESDFEIVDAELTLLLQWLVAESDAGLNAAVAAVRGVNGQQELAAAFAELRAALRRRGLQTTHAVMAAVAARLLRPGSSPATDALLHGTVTRWHAEEARLGIEIDARSLAYALSSSAALDAALGGAPALAPGQDVRHWRFSTLYGLLWPRGSQARNHRLTYRNPYASPPPAERWLVLNSLAPAEPEIAFASEEWERHVEVALIREARAAIVAKPAQLADFRQALSRQLVAPVDAGTLLLYPRIRALQRRRDKLIATLELTAPGQIAPGPAEDRDPSATARLVIRSSRGGRDEVRDLIESLFVTELLSAGEEIWLVSPWVTDLPLLDNRAGTYGGLDPGWPKRFLTLAEVLAFALRNSPHTRVRIVTRPDPHNRRLCERLQTLSELDATLDRLHIDATRETLHVKGFAGATFALKGSMNFTYNGIEVLDEAVELETDLRRVGQWLLNFHHHFAPSP